MKVHSLTILALSTLATARKGGRFDALDDGGVLPERARATAFIINDDGEPRIECWEFGIFNPNPSLFAKSGESKGFVSTLTLASHDDIDHVQVISLAPGTEYSSSDTGRLNIFSDKLEAVLTTIKGGLLEIETQGFQTGDASSAEEEGSDNIFADGNGDDWFYIEDRSSNSKGRNGATSRAQEATITTRTRSGGTTTGINVFLKAPLKHKKLHDGRCNFAGIRTDSISSVSDRDSPVHFRKQDL